MTLVAQADSGGTEVPRLWVSGLLVAVALPLRTVIAAGRGAEVLQ
ncbi:MULTISPECIES: hypothetical protein [unclassified Streptomyces]|nr:hypothetical protein [Streptomyces sp. CB01373]